MRHTRRVFTCSIKQISCFLFILCFAVLFTGCTLFTIVRNDQQAGGKPTGGVDYNDPAFDPNGYVNSIWDTKVIPYLKGKAINLAELNDALKGNADQAGSKYGYRGTGTSNPWNFIVKGRGKVLSVNTESRAAIMEIDLAPYDNKKDIAIAVGPVFKGTSIRDSLDFIKFEEFKNQIQYAQLANAFNKKVYETTISAANVNSLVNQEIDFTGAFTNEGTSVVVTPIEIGLSKEGK
jgi:predicted lipoprotein